MEEFVNNLSKIRSNIDKIAIIMAVPIISKGKYFKYIE
jgi:hypothetical protein